MLKKLKLKENLTIHLDELFILQKKLDDQIYQKHHVTDHLVRHDVKLALLVELAELANEVRCFKFWSLKPASEKKVILAEYVDCLHFIFNLALKYQIKPIITIKRPLDPSQNKQEITQYFLKLFKKADRLNSRSRVQRWMIIFWQFHYLLNLTDQEVITAYLNKNKINHQRQNNNY